VVVLGGDETLNEVANGLVDSETALAAIPGGSTNVFARTLGIPDDPIEATGVLLDSLEAGSTHRIGLGSVNQRYFLFHAGIGFDAAVVEQVEKKGGLLKRFAAHPTLKLRVITWDPL
jgi:Sphingosine kinase and enzymes related to eukaryotic diacylglycerol kinase